MPREDYADYDNAPDAETQANDDLAWWTEGQKLNAAADLETEEAA